VSFHKFSRHKGCANQFCSSFNLHLLSLADGSPHELPLQKVITLDLVYYRNPRVVDMEISGSLIALVTEASNFTTVRRDTSLIVWEWKTGEVVRDFSLWETGFNLLNSGG